MNARFHDVKNINFTNNYKAIEFFAHKIHSESNIEHNNSSKVFTYDRNTINKSNINGERYILACDDFIQREHWKSTAVKALYTTSSSTVIIDSLQTIKDIPMEIRAQYDYVFVSNPSSIFINSLYNNWFHEKYSEESIFKDILKSVTDNSNNTFLVANVANGEVFWYRVPIDTQ